MSFILDALKKSEHERQQHSPAEFAGVPTTSARRGAPRWLWIVGILLAINLAVLAGLLMRPAAPELSGSTPAAPRTNTVEPDAALSPPSFEERVAAAREAPPPEQAPVESTPDAARQRPRVEADVVTQNPASIDRSRVFPTFQQVIAGGAVALPPLHLDIHVFSDTPADRFVFVNMSKYREGATLDEGPSVDEITPDGVVLTHRGVSFLLPRE